MDRPVIHIFAPANPAGPLAGLLQLSDSAEMLEFIQEAVGERYAIEGRLALIDADADDRHGGRSDDAARAREINEVLADDRVAAMVALRGGGWLTRILPSIDFSLLNGRRKRIAVFGFSELTTLVNLVGRHRRGVGYYDLCPSFIFSGMAEYACKYPGRVLGKPDLRGKRLDTAAERWARTQFEEQFVRFFRDVVRILDGRGSSRRLTGRLVAGTLPAKSTVTLFGGCLSLVTPLTAAPYAKRMDPKGKWLVLEDQSETPHRIDRQFAHIKLAGWFDRCAGVLLGDFHYDDEDQTKLTLEILKHHLPKRRVHVITCKRVGHTWPLSPVPIGVAVQLTCTRTQQGRPQIDIAWPSDPDKCT